MPSEAKIEFRKAWDSFFPVLLFTCILWVLKISEYLGVFDLSKYGVYPDHVSGLKGILLAPMIHGDFMHIFSNTPPLLLLGTALLYFYPKVSYYILAIIWLGSGALVWLFARPNYHIGASGIIYGIAAFLFFSGFIKKSNPLLAISLLVTTLYGSMVWGILPLDNGVSWESHISGALMGMLCAWLFRHHGPDSSYKPIEDDENIHQHEHWNIQKMNVPPPFRVGEEE